MLFFLFLFSMNLKLRRCFMGYYFIITHAFTDHLQIWCLDWLSNIISDNVCSVDKQQGVSENRQYFYFISRISFWDKAMIEPEKDAEKLSFLIRPSPYSSYTHRPFCFLTTIMIWYIFWIFDFTNNKANVAIYFKEVLKNLIHLIMLVPKGL